jgi:hypothetical protein
MAELKTLDQALLLQLAQRPLPDQLHAALQHLEGPLEVVEPLAPADICIGHGVRLGSKATRGSSAGVGSAFKADHREAGPGELRHGEIGEPAGASH